MNTEELMQRVEDVVHDERVSLKAKMCDRVQKLDLAEEQKTELCAFLSKTIDDAFQYGQIAGIKPEDAEKMHETVKGLFSGVFGSTDSERAEKYRHLYFLQRILTDNLRNALTYDDSIDMTYERYEKGGVQPALSCMGFAACP